MNRLDGEVALISGPARGTGAATARLMVETGAKVAVGDVLGEPGRATAAAIGSLYQRLDLGREEDWIATVAAAVARFGGLDFAAARDMAHDTHPIGRLGRPGDIASGIVFLASDDAGFLMTGAGLVVDGGLTAQ